MKYKQVVITRLGGPEVLKVMETELMDPPSGQVQVKVLAAGVAFTDLSMRYGMYPGVPPLPYPPGYDIVGRVTALGPEVSSVQPGQLVAALTVTGGYSEYLTLPERKLVPVPDGLDPAVAVSLVLSYVTAYQLLHRVAAVKAGQRILVHGAAGGVGTALLQLGKLVGLECYGTASTGKQDYIRALGAVPIDYRTEDFVARVQQLTGDGVDVVFDNVGGAHLSRSRQALRKGGLLISYGFLSSLKDGKANKSIIVKTILILGLMTLFPVGKRAKFPPYDIKVWEKKHPAWFHEDLQTLFRLLQEGKIQPHVARTFPLEQAAEAQELLARGAVTGKIVLVM
jgi:NADPH:quinone reductase-like Zn-dependent oxidoreductase